MITVPEDGVTWMEEDQVPRWGKEEHDNLHTRGNTDDRFPLTPLLESLPTLSYGEAWYRYCR